MSPNSLVYHRKLFKSPWLYLLCSLHYTPHLKHISCFAPVFFWTCWFPHTLLPFILQNSVHTTSVKPEDALHSMTFICFLDCEPTTLWMHMVSVSNFREAWNPGNLYYLLNDHLPTSHPIPHWPLSGRKRQQDPQCPTYILPSMRNRKSMSSLKERSYSWHLLKMGRQTLKGITTGMGTIEMGFCKWGRDWAQLRHQQEEGGFSSQVAI